jgi:hypothetical protein
MMATQQALARGLFRGSSALVGDGTSSGLVPFDQAARFELKGVPGNIVQDVINISSDGAFVAVAIGYGFEEDRTRAVKLEPGPVSTTNDFLPGEVRLSQVPVAALIEGFRLNPRFERVILADPPEVSAGRRVALRERTFSTVRIPNTFDGNIIEQLKPPEEISFLFSIVDSGTGRELQDEPIHNLASLGSSNGDRPFRMLAKPLVLQPYSSLRLQIVERSEGLRGTLFIVLYGYKTLAGCAAPAGGVPAVDQSSRTIPFDYVTSFELTGSSGNLIEQEVPVNGEGGFVASTIGYGLAVESLDVSINGLPAIPPPPPPPTSPPPPPPVDLADLRFNQFPTSALQDGIRIRPNFLRIAFDSNGNLNEVPRNVIDRVFERVNRPEDVSFRYSIFDTGAGRELQNQPINNIAGLGIANGDRPFKRFARPMVFQPRSTIRVTVEERFGRGTLFIVFQGYKLLSSLPVSQASITARRTRRR